MNLLSPFPLCTTKLCASSSWGTGARKAGGYACSPCREEHTLGNSPRPAWRPVQLYLVTRRHTSFLDIFLWVLPLGRVPAAAAAKSLQSCPTLCNPIDDSPPGSPVAGILQPRTLEWVAIAFSKGGSHSLEIQYFIPFIYSLLDQLFNEHSPMAVDSGLVLDIQIMHNAQFLSLKNLHPIEGEDN